MFFDILTCYKQYICHKIEKDYMDTKTILITGATSGIGEACAQVFAKQGFRLILIGRRSEKLKALANNLHDQNKTDCFTICLDVQDKSAIDDAINNLPENWQQIDVLINNAGLALGRDHFDKANIADWEQMIDTNVKGLLYMSRAIIPFMQKYGKGHIINIGSTAAKEVYESGNVYCATKSAVEAISKAQRIDLLKDNIKVTCVHPGAVDTEFSLVRYKGDTEKAAKVYEGYQPLLAIDVANTISFIVNAPLHVCINDITLTCTQQANSFYINKHI
jgi:3-hydroxy acid dehydrogenase / malonic semialdehyde reductase